LTWTIGAYSLTATVDTSDAHFGSVPTYVATIAANPWSDPTIVGPLLSIVGAPTATSFTIQLLFGSAGGSAPTNWLTELAQQTSQLTISWIGLENMVSCS
jgi:hypothetical protein